MNFQEERLQAGPRSTSKGRLALVFGICLVLSTLVYLPGIRGDILNFDDERVAIEPISKPVGTEGQAELAFQDDVLASLGTILDPRRTIAEVYYPVTTLSYYLDWKLWYRTGSHRGLQAGQDPLPWHLHNLLLHALVGVLLVLLLLDLGLGLSIALAATLPFLVHPALAEVVTWIASRKDLLAALFGLLVLWRGRVALRENRALWPIWLFTLLACLSKGSALVLPLFAFLLWRPPFLEAPSSRRWRVLLGGVTVICLILALHQAVLASKAGVTALPGVAAAVPGTFLHYVGTLVWPVDLAVHHPLYVREGFASAAGIKALWWVLLGTAGVLLLLRGRRHLDLTGLGILVFFIALLPYNNWVPSTSIAAADRYLYLPALALPLMLAGIFWSLPRARRLPLSWGVTVLVVGVLGFLSHRRSEAFASSEALWEANLAVYPEDAVSLRNLGDSQWDRAKYLEEGREEGLQRAIDLFVRAYEVARLPEHRFDAALALFRYLHAMGRIDDSLAWGRKSVSACDDLASALPVQRYGIRIELIAAMISAGHLDDAQELIKETEDLYRDQSEVAALQVYLLLEKARRPGGKEFGEEAKKRFARLRLLKPTGPWLALVQARMLVEQGKNLEATKAITEMKSYRRVVFKTDPYFIEALYLLAARPYLANGNFVGAEAELMKGLQLDSISVRLRVRLAPVYASLSMYKEAEICLRVARKIQPGPELDRALAIALIGRVRGLVDKAQVEEYAPLVEEAAELAPGMHEVLWLRGRVLWGRKERAKALVLVRQAHRAAPRDEQITRDYRTLLRANGYAHLLAKQEEQALAAFRELLDNTPEEMRKDEKFVQDLLREHYDRRVKEASRVLLEQDFDKAIRLYESALEILPGEVGARFELGCAWYAKAKGESEKADLARAEKCFRMAVSAAEKGEQDPAWMVQCLAQTLQRQHRLQDARELLELYVEGVKKSLIRDPKVRKRLKELLDLLSS